MTATSQIDEQLLDEAEAWHRALEREDADWDGYILWLEADPCRGRAFDQVELAHRIVDERIGNLVDPEFIDLPPAAPASRRGWLYGLGAAALAIAIAVPALWLQASDTVYATRLGETRSIALGSGIKADLAPASRLVVHGRDATNLELAAGDVVFTVAHDPNRHLSIDVGGYSVSDIGTIFALGLSANAVKLGVAEGHLSITPDGGTTTIVSAGQQLIALRDRKTLRMEAIDRKAIGSWRQGRLTYVDTPLAVVASDISRYSGKTVTVDPAIGDQSFSGVLAIGDGSKLLADLAEIQGLSYEETRDGIRLRAASAR